MQLADFFENFEVLAAAPGGVARLREAVLSLAVRGRLVAQDPGDEPASVLLERIAAERSRLVKEKKIKKSEPLPPISADEVPFDLPSGWEWVRLQEAFVVITDGDHQAPPKSDTGLPFLVIGNVRSGKISFENTRFVPETYIQSLDWSKVPKHGDLLYTVVGSYGIPIFVDTDRSFCVQRHIAILKPSRHIFTNYLKLSLKSPFTYQQATDCATGIAQKTVPLTGLRRILISCPPLAEQKRIVEAVDRLMEQLDRLEAQQTEQRDRLQILGTTATTQLTGTAETRDRVWPLVRDRFATIYDTPDNVEQLRQTILQLAVMGRLVPQDPNDEPASVLLERIREEKARLVKEKKIKKSKPLPPISPDEVPFDIPGSWEWTYFAKLGELARGKSKHRPRNDPSLYQNGEYPLVQTGDVARANGVIGTYTALYNETGLKQSRLWEKGTLCITIAANIADTARLGFDACFPDSVVGFVPFSGLGSSLYVEFFLRTAKSSLEAFAPSTAQKNINLAILEALLIPLPPLTEQKRIVTTVDRLMTHCDRLQTQLQTRSDRARALLDSAIHQLSQTA